MEDDTTIIARLLLVPRTGLLVIKEKKLAKQANFSKSREKTI